MDPWNSLYVFLVAAPAAWLVAWVSSAMVESLADPKRREHPGRGEIAAQAVASLGLSATVAAVAYVWLPWTSVTKAVVAGTAILALIALLERRWELSPDLRLILQVAAAGAPVVAGLKVTRMTLPIVGGFDLSGMAWVFPALVILAVISMSSLAEEMEGAGTAVGMVAGATLAAVALSLDRNRAGVLAALGAAVALGLFMSRYGRSSITVRLTGAGTVGLMVAVAVIQGKLKTVAVPVLFVPLVLLTVGSLDEQYQLLRRFAGGGGDRVAEVAGARGWIVDGGLDGRRTRVLLLGWLLALAGVSLAIRFLPYSDGHGSFRVEWVIAIGAAAALALVVGVLVVGALQLQGYLRMRVGAIARECADGGMDIPDLDSLEEQVIGEVRRGELIIPEGEPDGEGIKPDVEDEEPSVEDEESGGEEEARRGE